MPSAPAPAAGYSWNPRTWGPSTKRWFGLLGGDQALYPLVILFGLNAVDELDRTAFGVLLPNIRDSFGLSNSGILTVVALSSLIPLLMGLPIGFYADRMPRVMFVVVGATTWGLFSVFTGLAPTVALLVVARMGAGMGKAVNDPVHNSLIADYYDIPQRPGVYSFHRAANAIGQFVGPLLGGLLGFYFGWRTPFIVFGIPTILLVILALRLKEPMRGYWERRATGAAEHTQLTEDIAPSFAESWRICWSVRTLRRIYYALPFLAVSIVGLASLTALLYEDAFNLDARARGFVAASAEPAAVIGLIIGIPIATKLMARDPGLVMRFLGFMGLVVAAAILVFALVPYLALAIAMNVVLSGVGAVLAPGVVAALSLAVPPKIRTFGYGVMVLWVLPGLLVLPIIGWVADNYGIRTGLAMMTPVFLLGATIIASSAPLVKRDVAEVWRLAAAQSEVLWARREGQAKLLLARGIDVHYDGVQVLFGVDFEIDEGEIVALLGTNGAGKSTLLKAISGITEASAGAVVFDGRDMTHTPPDEVAGRGVTLVPGGRGVFTGLTVAENLQLAGWLHRKDPDRVAAATERVLDIFPILRRLLQEPAGNLSGGQQQMLTLGMAFIERPRLLMIDELSLGLAPAVVSQLFAIIEELRRVGTTIIVVEQSVNVALTLTDTAYFMEKGEIRFRGATADLLERPDILRSVFLEGTGGSSGAAAGGLSSGGTSGAARDPDGTRSGPSRGSVVNGGDAGGDLLDGGDRAAEAARVDAHIPDVTAGSSGAGDPVDPALLSLSIKGVSKRFGGITALDDVDLDVFTGEILGFIGPNGAGKTTLFDVISGFLPADAGRVLLRSGDGVHDITGRPAQDRADLGLGRSFQDGRLFPSLSVRETIALSLERHVEVKDPIGAAMHLPWVGASERKVHQRVDELVELFGLGAFGDKLVRELSTGSRRVVDLACIVAHGPSVVLLDEPSSGIAQKEAEALVPLLRQVRDELSATVLLIEHDIALLRAVADRMVAMEVGAIVTVGPPEQVVIHPQVISSYLGDDAVALDRSTHQPAAT